jgi:hypothetical protein
MASSINASTTGVGGVVNYGDTSGDLNIQSGGSTKIAVTSAGVAVTGLSKGSLPTGSVLQVVSATYSTQTTSTSGSYADTGITATITPTSATSKILCMVTHGDVTKSAADTWTSIRLLRAGATVMQPNLYLLNTSSSAVTGGASQTTIYLDSPATTSATIYKTQFATAGIGTITLFASNTTGSIILMEIAA